MDDIKRRLELAKQTGITMILTLEDLKLSIDPDNEKKTIESIEDLIMVHTTDYMPTGAIRTPKSTQIVNDDYISQTKK